jgi:hypothetical protein
MCKKYNGYTNYETWNVALWIDNEQWLYEEVKHLTRHATNKYDLANQIKEIIESMNPLNDQASMYSDLLGAAISSCNFYEIANNWIEDNKDEPEEETDD